MEERKTTRTAEFDIETPLILKHNRRTPRSPSPIGKFHLPPNRSGMFSGAIENFRPDFGNKQNTVVVFGYPEGLKDFVIDKFKRLGKIEEIRVNEGNWMNIVFEDFNSAHKALGLNFQFIAEGVMVGVKLLGNKEAAGERVVFMDQGGDENVQYLKRATRRNAGFLEQVFRYVLNKIE